MNLTNRTIYCNDNIEILKGINSNSIDLIYLDPPFNKKKTFSAPIGSSSEGASFRDTFREEDVKDEWVQEIKEDYEGLHNFLIGIKELSNITESKSNKHYLYNYCYLCYMAIRLVEMRRVLKETGSIYLHCDNTMGHYLKILMDIIFGEKNFLNNIVWFYNTQGKPKKAFAKKYDDILFYSKNINFNFNKITINPNDINRYNKVEKGTGKKYQIDGKGYKYYLEDGRYCPDYWEIPALTNNSKERTGYPTQKPIALLERIIKASSKEGDIVLDPFCGCATTCIASEKLGRQWVGIDVSFKAYELVKERLKKEVQGIGKQGKLDVNTELKNDYDKLLPNPQNHPPKRTDVNGDDGITKKYVYIVSHPNYKYYKVGVSKNSKGRLSGYQTGDPNREYTLEYQFLTPHFREIEKHIHKKFKNRSEWVQASTEEIIKEIENYKK